MKNTPLADKLRPETLDEVIGQKHLIGENKIITQMIKKQKSLSLVFYGKPGIGKTTLAKIIANELNCPFMSLNAVYNSKAEFKDVIEQARFNSNMIVIIDEIHRMDKAKQDFLLPFIEKGTITIIATTTENPYFSLNPAIRSRVQIIELLPITNDDIVDGLKKITSSEKINLSNDVIEVIAANSNGDFRVALNYIDLITSLYDPDIITPDIIKKNFPKKNLNLDKNTTNHYDLLSALQKSIRGSDVDAALYYSALLIKTGDLTSLNRRLVCIAYEDIGLANPSLPPQIVTAVEAIERLGMPEAKLVIGHIICQLALSPKSNSGYLSINAALNYIDNNPTPEVLEYLKDGRYGDLKSKENYIYPHDLNNNISNQPYLPKGVNQTFFTSNSNNKYEKQLLEYKKYVDSIRN